MIGSLPPAAIMILGALLVPALSGRIQKAYILALPILGFLYFVSLGTGEFGQVGIFSYELTLVRIDGLSRIFGYLFHIAAVIGLIFAMRAENSMEHVACLLYTSPSPRD